jgi:tRNA(Ile)-lysidine synthase
MDPRQFHSKLFRAARHLIPPGAKVLCAVSGGADSMAMLDGLCAVNGLRNRRWLLSIAHLDHRIRTDSRECAEFVRNAAAEFGLECCVESIDVPAIVRKEGGSLEEIARRARYGFFHRTAGALGANIVAVAHHADDQAETVLHRAFRGTGLHGLSGMPIVRAIADGSHVHVVRPFLGFRRDELREYVSHRDLHFREDVTNADSSAATRNRIRHEILPMLESALNPKVVEALVRLAEQARKTFEAIEAAAALALNEIRIDGNDGEIRLKAGALANFPLAIRSEIVRLALKETGAPLGSIGQERIDAAAELACRGRHARVVELPGGIHVERRREFWTIRSHKPVRHSRAQGTRRIERLYP